MISIFLFTLLAWSGWADEAPTPPPPPQTKIIYRKSERQEFSGTKLKGNLKKPELSYIYERKGLRQEQIINIPENFDDEIIDGAGQL